jgi:hypothetical protein
MLIASLIRCLKSVDLEVMYASWWSGNWQIMWGLLTFPLNWIPMPPPATNNPPLETGEFLVRAWRTLAPSDDLLMTSDDL